MMTLCPQEFYYTGIYNIYVFFLAAIYFFKNRDIDIDIGNEDGAIAPAQGMRLKALISRRTNVEQKCWGNGYAHDY